jgi:hypothetical protein
MDENELQEVKDAVAGELGNMKDTIAIDLKKQFDAETAERHEKWEKSLSDIKKDLVEMGKSGQIDPTDQVVVDLEKKINEQEARQLELEEKLRLAQTTQIVVSPENKELDWGGRFLNVTDDLKKYLRTYWMGGEPSLETRALDTGLFATGGALPAEVRDAFIDFVIEQQATLSRVVTIRMNAPQGHTDELRVSTRALRAATEGVAPTPADSVTTARRTLNTVETILGEDITMTLLEDNIERAGAEGHIARIIATAFGNDSNDLVWNGDDASSDPFISINDGYLKLLQNSQNSDITDVDLTAAGVTTGTAAMQELLQAMPDKFLGRTDHVFWAAVSFAQKYAEEVSARETQLGDQVLIQGFPALRYFGIPLVPETHIASAARRLILTPTSNLFWGIQRILRVDSEFRPRTRLIEYTLSARTDAEYATGEPVVNGTLVPVTIN